MTAREELEAARTLLLSPSAEALDRSCAHLERAVAELREAPEVAHTADVLEAVSRVTALVENAGQFYAGWSRRAAAAACGYMPTGEPAGLPARRNLSIEG